MRTFTRTAVLLALPAILLLGPDAPATGGVSASPGILVFHGRTSEVAMVRWAAERYERAGLQLPTITVYFHPDQSGCDGLAGTYVGGRVDVCTRELDETTTRDTLLHEMGHAWTERNLSGSEQERFMSLRGLDTWNSSTAFWPFRGWEQASEIMAWGLGERVLLPKIPDHAPEQLRIAFEALTGQQPPAL